MVRNIFSLLPHYKSFFFNLAKTCLEKVLLLDLVCISLRKICKLTRKATGWWAPISGSRQKGATDWHRSNLGVFLCIVGPRQSSSLKLRQKNIRGSANFGSFSLEVSTKVVVNL